jgi:hypothetical protein
MSEHRSCDGYTVNVGDKFWSNDLRVVKVTKVAAHSNPYSDTGCTQTWHNTTEDDDGDSRGGSFDTLDGSMQPYGRLARFYNGQDAEDYPAGTNYSDINWDVPPLKGPGWDHTGDGANT